MEKKSTLIVLAVAAVLCIAFAVAGMNLGVFLSVWSGIAGMIILHYANNRKMKTAKVF